MDTRKGIIAWFARNSVAANLLMAFLLVGGIFSVFTIQKEVFPKFELNMVRISVPYPGAAPEEVESGIITRIEEAIKEVEGIEKLTSRAYEGTASISIEVEDGYPVKDVLDDVKLNVDAISTLPERAEKPLIYEAKPEQDIIWVQVYGEMSEYALKELGKTIREEIIALPGVGKTRVYGQRDYEISIELSELELQRYGLTFAQVADTVRAYSLDLPSGTVRTEGGDILIRAKSQAYQGSEFADIILLTRDDGTRVRLGDIAQVTDGFEEVELYSRFDRQPGISIGVMGVGEHDALQIANTVKDYVAEKAAQLPAGIQLSTWGDSSFYLKDRLDLMLSNLVYGGLLVFIILAAFLRLRLAFWVLLGLPVCFLGTLLLMPISPFGLSINMISLFGFILVLGIVVDDAIIIGESVYSEIEQNGHSMDNVIRGAQRVAVPATFGVLTTIAAFIPMLMVSGTMGVIWKTIGLVVILCLAFSLLESKFILPAHLVHMKVDNKPPSRWYLITRFRLFCSGALMRFIQGVYLPSVRWATEYRYVALAGFVAIFILTIGLLGGGLVRWVFFPNIPSDFISADVEMVEGAPEKATIRAVEQVLDGLYKMDSELGAEIGQSVVKHSLSWTDGVSGQVFVELSKGEDRDVDGFDIANRWRDATGELTGIRSIKFNGSMNNAGGDDLAFKLGGKDLKVLKAAAEELKQAMAGYAGVFDVQDDFSGGKEEAVLRLKPTAYALGLTLQDVALQVRYGFYGAEAQRLQRGTDEVKVMVRYPRDQRRSLGHLENMRIRTASGAEVPFSTIAEFTVEPGYSRITRIDGERAITVVASADKSKVEPDKISKEIREQVLPELLQKYPGIDVVIEGASKEEQEAMVSLLQAAVLAVMVIYALMAIPLKSYLQPIIIMSVIPFGVIGAIVGHWLLGLSISVLSLCGIIALTGVVVNDSLIMVDFVNRARKEGMSMRDAVIQSGVRRFRAILLTSLTTFFGLVPIILERSLQAQIVIPMAVSLAFGILFATVITLYMVPCLYLALADLKGLLFGKPAKPLLQPMANEG